MLDNPVHTVKDDIHLNLWQRGISTVVNPVERPNCPANGRMPDGESRFGHLHAFWQRFGAKIFKS